MTVTINSAKPVSYVVNYCLKCGRVAAGRDSNGYDKCSLHIKQRNHWWSR